MSDAQSALNPKDTTNWLLGGMQKQLEAIERGQENERIAREDFRTEVRDSIRKVNDKLVSTASDVEVLKSKQAPRVHWLTIVVGVIAVAGFTLGILDRLYNP